MILSKNVNFRFQNPLQVTKNGYVSPLVLFFIFLFISIPIIYWGATSWGKSAVSVKGTSDVVLAGGRGISVEVTSVGGTWDLYAYLCNSEEECSDNLTSGKKIGVFSGGNSEQFLVQIPYDSSWDSHKYVKLYVKTGWGSTSRTFSVSGQDEQLGLIYKEYAGDTGRKYNLILVPVEKLGSENNYIGSFSDK
ncbi:hypothetical protein A2619_01940 [candidate division WWE3 bacterium RIFOXYD1_FULL_39_9]|uniref:Uncharacterized protein n=1 Tax=candidate division WWE3 bacterium RIFOXYD1_FULL_39_9 TaxID=1802649 RepID=A0A1F4X743_UNCKA|nr:MAG: hypothetical protein A2619_01940 [candidate division WWE3 bacterium RIFOXYD1_FULL_39_9]